MKNNCLAKILFLVLITATVSSCSYNITRKNYSDDISIQKAKEAQKSGSADCDVTIRRELDVAKDDVKFLGKMKLREGGATWDCTEADAINILKKEACFLGANLIVITHESRPNVWSTCYSCDASFYNSNLNNPINPVAESKKDEHFKSKEVSKRDKKDADNRVAYWIGAIIGGLLIGFLL